MVFWANVGENTYIDGIGMPSAHLTYTQIAAGDPPTVGSGDKLWYAPYGTTSRADEMPLPYYSLTVPEEGEYNDVVYFTHAHRTVRIYINGPAVMALPRVELKRLPAGLTHSGMERLPDLVTAYGQTVSIIRDDVEHAAIGFDTFRFDGMEEMEDIEIAFSTDVDDRGEFYSVSLAEAVREAMENGGADPDAIALDLQFNGVDHNPDSGNINVDVTITMPGWDVDETEIGF
jgi:hypothetical protein